MALTEKRVAEQIAKLKGNVSAVARAFGVTRQSVQGFVDRHPNLKSLLTDAREEMVDNGESALHVAVLKGEAWAVCFVLKTQGKGRGYVERQEHTGEAGAPIAQSVTVVVKRDRNFFGGGPAAGAHAPPDPGPPKSGPV